MPRSESNSAGVATEEASPSLRRRLKGGGTLVGTVVSSPDAVLAERLASVFDFLWIDLEHSALTVRDAQVLAIAIRSGGAFTLARLPRPDSELLDAVLDSGVDGVVAPRVSSDAEAAAFARALRYPPDGTRGYAPRRARFLRASSGTLEADVACIVQVENRAALDDIDAIAAVDGVDALVVGANDLSLAIGAGLDLDSADLATAVERVGRAAAAGGFAWGVAVAAVPEWVLRVVHGRAAMVVFASDLRLYSDGIAAARERLRSLLDAPWS